MNHINKKNVIITGVAGMIGSNLANRLITNNYNVYGIDYLEFNSQNLLKKIAKHNFSYFNLDLSLEKNVNIFYNKIKKIHFESYWHLAANSDIQKGSENSNIELRNTFLSSYYSVKICEKLNIQKFCFFSSSAIYGETRNKIKETHGPILPISNYGAMKVASEAFLSSARFQIKDILIFRLPNVIGPDVTHGFFYDIPNKIRRNDIVQILGNGLQKKPFMHVDHLLKIILKIYKIKYLKNINIFNVGPGDSGITVKKIINLFISLKKIKNTKFLFQHKKNGWQGDVAKYKFNNSKILKLCKFNIPSSEESVVKTIKEIKL